MENKTSVPRVVVLGVGFGGLESAFYLRKRLGKRVGLTVVAPSDRFWFKPNTIYIPFGGPKPELSFEVAPVFERKRIGFVQGLAEGIDSAAKRIRTSSGEIPYDYLIIATGAAMHAAEIPGLGEHAHTIWTPQDMRRLEASLKRVLVRAWSERRSRVLFLVPPNNKCAGPLYEMVLMLDTWLRRERAREAVDLSFTTCEGRYIQVFGPRLHEYVTEEFTRRGVTGKTQMIVERVESGHVVYTDGSRLPYDALISFPPYIAAQRFDPLPSDDRGFLRVNERTRQVENEPDIYAVGDAGNFPVKQAFLALLQADTAAEHISERILGEKPIAAFDPVSMCIMEQFDKATFARVPLRLTGDPSLPVVVREDALDQYRVGSSRAWRIGKKTLGAAIPSSFEQGRPFHAGATWSVMNAGLKMMTAAFAQ